MIFQIIPKKVFEYLVRDHAKDDDSWDSRSNQRKIFTAKLDPKLCIKKAEIIDHGNSIDILWSDLNKSINYSSNFLWRI